jgi:hypothetical protein
MSVLHDGRAINWGLNTSAIHLRDTHQQYITLLWGGNRFLRARESVDWGSNNPFGNTLMTDYVDNPHKKPAPPSFNENINEDILAKAKETVTKLNPGQPDMADKLFHDLGEQLVFEQSMRNFYSNPATTIPNDQTSFAEFCYGSMVSCKEGNQFACARNLARHTL